MRVPFARTIYEFEDCAVDPSRFELRRGGVVEHVEPQVFDVLVHLIRHRDRVVTKAELLDTVWGDRFVSESALASRLKSARRAVGDDGAGQRVIRTVFGRGYQFVAPVVEHHEQGAPAPTRAGATPTAPLQQTVRFCTASDGHRIAYATIGSGPVLVKAANWLTHLDHDRETSVWGHWLEGLADGPDAGALRRAGVRDVRLGRRALPVRGLGRRPRDGGRRRPASTASRCSACRRGRRSPWRSPPPTPSGSAGSCWRAPTPAAGSPGPSTEEERREAALDLEVARVGWGRDDPSFRQVFTSQFLPDGTREEWEEFNELQRITTSPENAVRFLETFARIDVTDAGAEGQVPDARPALPRRPAASRSSGARDLAALIPDCEFVPLPSRNHILREEPAWPIFLAELDRFLSC